MLSHHEIAALLSAGDQCRTIRAFDSDITALCRQHLLTVRLLNNGLFALRVTNRGRVIAARLRNAVTREVSC
jgi:hypothetical protein